MTCLLLTTLLTDVLLLLRALPPDLHCALGLPEQLHQVAPVLVGHNAAQVFALLGVRAIEALQSLADGRQEGIPRLRGAEDVIRCNATLAQVEILGPDQPLCSALNV